MKNKKQRIKRYFKLKINKIKKNNQKIINIKNNFKTINNTLLKAVIPTINISIINITLLK